MTHEDQRPSPSPQPAEAAGQAEAKLGIKQLAGNLVKIIDAGGEQAVREYLTDVLADKEGKVPKQERQATFDFLAREQQEVIQETLVDAGDRLLTETGQSTSHTQRFFDEKGRTTKRFVAELKPGKRPREHDEAIDGSNKILRDLAGYNETNSAWKRKGITATETFAGVLHQGIQHKTAIKEAGKVVDPEYEGEPKDISKVIDEKVMAQVSKKLKDKMEAARLNGEEPEAAVIEIIDKDPSEFSQADLKFLVDFDGYYHEHVTRYGSQIGNGLSETDHFVRRFKSREDEARYLRSDRDIEESFHQQRRSLGSVSELFGKTISTAETSLRDAALNISNVQQQLELVKRLEKA